MQSFFDLLNALGYISTIIVLIGVVIAIYAFAKGIAPVLWRLGIGLSRRKIAVFADSQFEDLEALLVDSGLFQKSNVIQITKSSLKKAEAYNLFLVHYKAFEDEMEKILAMKQDATALIVYSPQEDGFINPTYMAKINAHRNATVVNLRGRLLNDVLVSIITTRPRA